MKTFTTFNRITNKQKQMKKNFQKFLDSDKIIHPSELLKDEMIEQNITQRQIIQASGYNKSVLSLFLRGRRNITIQLAIALELTLNIKAVTWMKIQQHYEFNSYKVKINRLIKDIKTRPIQFKKNFDPKKIWH